MEIFDEMTKEEIIQWIKETIVFYHNKPKKSWLYFHRWQKQSRELLEKQCRHTDRLTKLGSKERDDYAKQFNASTDPHERVRLAELMQPYHNRLKVWLKESDILDKEQERVGALHVKSEKERKKEATK